MCFVISFFCIFATVTQNFSVDKIYLQALINTRFFTSTEFVGANMRQREAAHVGRGFLSCREAAMNAPIFNKYRRFRLGKRRLNYTGIRHASVPLLRTHP